MHSPIIVSMLILLAMMTTLLVSVHVDNDKITIQPSPRNFIFNPASNQTVDVRGPYTVDGALENEFTSIRMPQEALTTLELNYGDSIYINNQKYILNQTRPGEDNIMRIPNAAKTFMGLIDGDKITDGDLRNRFNNFYAVKAISTGNSSDLNLTEGIIITTNLDNGRTVDIFRNDQQISHTSGVFKNGTYSIYVNGVKYRTFTYNENNSNNTYYIEYGNDLFKIVIGGPELTDMDFAPSSSGKFLNFQY